MVTCKPHTTVTHVLLLMTVSLHMPQTLLLSKLPIPDSQVITINPKLPVEEAAEDYAIYYSLIPSLPPFPIHQGK